MIYIYLRRGDRRTELRGGPEGPGKRFTLIAPNLKQFTIFKWPEMPTSEAFIIFERTEMSKPATFVNFKGPEMTKAETCIIFRGWSC